MTEINEERKETLDELFWYLKKLTRLYPELRFGQLMHIISDSFKGTGGAYERDIYEVKQIPNHNKEDLDNPTVQMIEYQGSFIDTFNVEDADFLAKAKENFETDFLRLKE